jgi:hypothetical protein
MPCGQMPVDRERVTLEGPAIEATAVDTVTGDTA